MQDLRYALRALRKQPIFTLVASLTLTLGIGANTAIFSLFYHVLLRPLPYGDPGRLVFVWNAYKKAGGEPSSVSIPDTPSFFSTLRRGPSLGRAFTGNDARTGADRFVILTHDLRVSRFNREPSVVGRDIRLNGEPYAVVGVLPADFELPWRKVALLVPFAFTPAQTSNAERGNEFSRMIARLRPGASIEQLNAQMQAIVNRLMDRVPARAAYMRNSGFTGVAIAMRDQPVGDVRSSLYLLQAGVLIVLLIACANVANLLLMRAAGRHRELAIRTALGAGRWRLTRQLLMEGAVLSALGAAGGVIVAIAGVRGLLAMAAEQLPEGQTTVIQPQVLMFTLALTVVTALVFGLVPAIPLVRNNTASALKDDSARGTSGKRTGAMRATLVVAETALAVILLIGAGLLVKGFARLVRVDPGFSPEHVLTAQIALPASRYGDGVARRAFWQRLLDRTRALPGVNAAGLVSTLPFSGNPSSGSYMITGHGMVPGDKPPHAGQNEVDGDYFRAMGIALVDGRLFNDGDSADSPRVVVVDQFLANRQFPGASAIGRQLNFGSPCNYTIVGVVRTIHDADLAQPIPEERIYLNATQLPSSGMSLVVKTTLEPATLVPQVRAAVRALDPEQAISEVRTMDQWVARSLSGRRTPMTLSARRATRVDPMVALRDN